LGNYNTLCQHGQAGHVKYHALLAEGKLKEAQALPYFQDMLQSGKHGQHGRAGQDNYYALLAEGSIKEAQASP